MAYKVETKPSNFLKDKVTSSNEKLFEPSFKLATVSTLKSCSNKLKAL